MVGLQGQVGAAVFDSAVLARFDLESGEREVLADVTDALDGAVIVIAADSLAMAPVPAVEPASPLDPRVVTGLVLGTLLAAGWALFWWRRRRVRLA